MSNEGPYNKINPKIREYTVTADGGAIDYREGLLSNEAGYFAEGRDLGDRTEQLVNLLGKEKRLIVVKKCNRVKHWNLTVTIDTETGVKETEVGNETPCDCPDKLNLEVTN